MQQMKVNEESQNQKAKAKPFGLVAAAQNKDHEGD